MSDEIQIQILRELEKQTEVLHMLIQVICTIDKEREMEREEHQKGLSAPVREAYFEDLRMVTPPPLPETFDRESYVTGARQKFDMHEGDF